jgi:hypothetical protein
MNSHPIAILMASESTRRRLHEPLPERPPRKPRRAAARVLQAVAVRLDPGVGRPHLSR